LGPEEQCAARAAVGNHARPERERQHWRELRERQEPEHERRAREPVHEPALRHRLHPGADERDELAAEEEPEVAMPERAEAVGER